MSEKRIESGDRVSFKGKRGETITGTVTRIRMKHRKGRVRELAERVTGDPHSLDREVAEITPDNGKGIWTVCTGSLTYLGKGNREEAAAAAYDTKRKIAAAEEKRSTANFEAADAAGLYNLELGAPIEVEFSDIGWTTVAFAGFVSGSGNVRFLHRGRTKTISPKFARAKKIEAATE